MANAIGQYGEQVAAGYLLGKGYYILDKNFRTRNGEVDIIARHHGTIVFVEVKTRRSSGVWPEVLITRKKIIALERAALTYLSLRQIESPWRIEAIAITLSSTVSPQLVHYETVLRDG